MVKSNKPNSEKSVPQSWRERKGLQPGDTPLENLPRITLTPNSEIVRLAQKQPKLYQPQPQGMPNSKDGEDNIKK
jgi:hypothetical protein